MATPFDSKRQKDQQNYWVANNQEHIDLHIRLRNKREQLVKEQLTWQKLQSQMEAEKHSTK